MKKILFIFIITFLLLGNITFAQFNIETKLSAQKQELYKKQIDSVYKNFENKLSKLNEEKQIINLEKIIGKIEIILNNKISDKNNFVLSYLNYLLKDKLDFLLNNDENINLGEILKIEEKNNNTEVVKDKIQEQNIQKTINCESGYINQNGTCIKKEETPINISVNNQVTTRGCYIENGKGQETFQNDSWGTCNLISCNNSYHKEGNACLSNEKSCNIDNGKGYKNWNGVWSDCNISYCNSGFENQNGKCLKTCNSSEHREGDICIANKIACDIENGKGEKERKNSSWGECYITNCDKGYDLKNGIGTNMNNTTYILGKNNKCEKIYLNLNIKNTKNTIHSSSDIIANLKIDTNLNQGNFSNICFISNIVISKDYQFSLKVNDGSNLGTSNFKDGKLCFISYFGDSREINLYLTSNNVINEDLGKIYNLNIEKESLAIRSSAGIGEYYKNNNIYYINEINYSEE